jgi:acyl carrier protein
MMENRIKNVMSAVFEISVEEINDQTGSDTIDSWDSLNLMNLVVSLEEEFDIQLDEQDIEKILNFKLICEIIKQKL